MFQPSFPNSALPTFVLSFSKTYPVKSPGAQAGTSLPRPSTSLQTHVLPTFPKLPPRKSPPCTRLARSPPLSHESQGLAMLPKGRLPKDGLCAIPVPLGGQDSLRGGTAQFIWEFWHQQHLWGGMGQQGRRWDGIRNAVTSSWPHWVLYLHLRGKNGVSPTLQIP